MFANKVNGFYWFGEAEGKKFVHLSAVFCNFAVKYNFIRIMKWITVAAVGLALFGCSGKNGGAAAESQNEAEATPAVEFNADSAYRYVERQTEFGPRVPGSASHGACADFLENELKRHGADTVMTQRGSMPGWNGAPVPVRNIMGRFNMSAPKRVLLAAHYDTRPWADEEEDSGKHNHPIDGANDGASGVGVLLELARLIGEKAPETGVDILFVDAEDMGKSGDNGGDETWCLGTQMWIANMPYGSVSERPVYGIVLDMVGGRDAVFYREYVSERMARGVNDRVWGSAARSPYAQRFVNEVRGSLIDDHLFINRGGIPCIDIVECGNAVTGSFPETWHTLNDNMSNIDRSTLKAVGQVVADVIYGERK